jgi:hypothetical protein
MKKILPRVFLPWDRQRLHRWDCLRLPIRIPITATDLRRLQESTPLSASRTIWQSGAALGTDAVSAAINLPSAFKFNGKSYNAVYLSNNGFVTLGTAALAATYTGLSTDTTTPYEGAFAGFAANLKNANTTTSEISYETVGSKFIVQFKDLQEVGHLLRSFLIFRFSLI